MYIKTYINIFDSNGIQTHNHLVHKRTPFHLAKLARTASLAKGSATNNFCQT